MKKVISKIKDVLETLFYSAFAIFFILILPIMLIYNRQFLGFCLIYVPIILIFVIGGIGYLRDKKYKKSNITEYKIEDKKLGEVKAVQDNKKNILSFEGILFDKYNPNIEIKNYDKDNKKLYFDALGYIKENQKEIEKELKRFYLSNYLSNYDKKEKDIEDSFKIEFITTKTYMDLVTYRDEVEENGYDVEGIENLRNLINNSKSEDIFLEIVAECDCISSEDFANAYINCRTNEICYCYDIIE